MGICSVYARASPPTSPPTSPPASPPNTEIDYLIEIPKTSGDFSIIVDEFVRPLLLEYHQIVKIRKINNPAIHAQYEKHKPDREVGEILFHGTSECCAKGIAKHGYLIHKSRLGDYGYGIYFSKCVKYALLYATRRESGYNHEAIILINRVYFGKKTKYLHGRWSYSTKHDPEYHTYDSVCVNNGQVVCIRQNYQACPLYVINVRLHVKHNGTIGTTYV